MLGATSVVRPVANKVGRWSRRAAAAEMPATALWKARGAPGWAVMNKGQHEGVGAGDEVGLIDVGQKGDDGAGGSPDGVFR